MKGSTTIRPKRPDRLKQPPEGYRRLYYFTTKEFALQSLRDKRLKIARFSELNDPFDFLGIALRTPGERIAIQEIKDEVGDRMGILCMARTWSEPLLWGHYADKHKGICLQFLVKATEWQDIQYRKERPTLRTFGKNQVSDLTVDDQAKLSIFKFSQWEYEQECRSFLPLNEPDMVTGHYFLKFNQAEEEIRLERVIIGSRCEVKRETVQSLVKHNGDNVRLIKARPAHLTFSVIEDTKYEDKI